MTDDTTRAVAVTDISIPFSSMVWLLLKFTLAAVPVTFILLVLWAAFGGVIAGL